MRYSELIDYFIRTDTYEPIPLQRQHVAVAEELVLRLFPPSDTMTTFQLLAALNLLNAAVKTPWGREMVGYDFIKGYAGLLFQHVNEQHIPDVDTYWDKTSHIAYFRVYGVQISFHYIIMSKALVRMMPQINTRSQKWTGQQLQHIAVEVFLLACPTAMESQYHLDGPVRKVFFSSPLRKRRKRFLRKIPMGERGTKKHFPTPTFEHGVQALSIALRFNIWRTDCFTLYSKRNNRALRVIRFDGNNHQQLNDFLRQRYSYVCDREKQTLTIGKHYFVSPQLHIIRVSPSRYVRLLTHHCFLMHRDRCWNLCITYEIALWLSLRYPRLYFVNILNANREIVRTRYYRYASLLRVPAHSKARCMRIWMVVDNHWDLQDFDIKMLPASLIEGYLRSKEFWNTYQVVRHKNLYGIYAHCRYHLLDTVYPDILIRNNYAVVMRSDGKKAIYSLCLERFVTDFQFDRFWFDIPNFTLYGVSNNSHTVIFRLMPQKRMGRYRC